MNSDELNKKINEICLQDDPPYEAFGGKAIPYIGWFWRKVNFNSKDYDFGILPTYDFKFDKNDKERLGFMENNKWDYEYKHCPPKQWEEIKSLLEIAVTSPSYETLKEVDDKIQSLLKRD